MRSVARQAHSGQSGSSDRSGRSSHRSRARVALAFLLTVPFTDRFHELDTVAKDVYLAALVLIGMTSVLLIAPTVHHRLASARHAAG